MAMAMFALGMTMCAFADTQYKVYDFALSLNTTKAGGSVATSCGDTYKWRQRGVRKIQGVVAGCGCIAMAGDPSCNNFVIYMWDVTTKTQLTNFTYETKLMQRVGKKGEIVEQYVELTIDDEDDEKFTLVLCGLGTYTISKQGANYDRVAVSGYATGIKAAPYLFTKGVSACCGNGTPDSYDQTTAVKICEDGVCTASDDSDTTVCYGIYSFRYNASKSTKCEKRGISANSLGLPFYVTF